MKTTVELPDDLLRRTKATAALRGESMKDLLIRALEAHLDRLEAVRRTPGWRAVFGGARSEDVAEVDAVIEDTFEQVRPEDWS